MSEHQVLDPLDDPWDVEIPEDEEEYPDLKVGQHIPYYVNGDILQLGRITSIFKPHGRLSGTFDNEVNHSWTCTEEYFRECWDRFVDEVEND